MTIISDRLLRARKEEAPYDLEREACEEIDRLTHALKRLTIIALEAFRKAEGEQFDAIEEAVSVLAEGGDKECIAVQKDWARDQRRFGLP